MLVELDGISGEDLRRQREFLVSRAEHWIGDGDVPERHLACAATLWRDAASLSLMLGKVGEARPYLKRAGQLFLRAGSAQGAVLVVLADQEADAEPGHYAGLVGEAMLRREPGATETGGFAEMLSRFQVGCLTERRSDFMLSDSPGVTGEAAARVDGYRVGETGLTFGSYRGAMEAMPLGVLRREIDEPEAEMPWRVAFAVNALGMARSENLRAAMADRHHWRMMLRPSVLIDYDAVILLGRALMAGLGPDSLQQAMPGEISAVLAPLRAAELLRPVVRKRSDPDEGAVAYGK